MDKKRLFEEILAELRSDVETMLAAAQATHKEATHEDNKAESKYDTRGLEASYLAEGQARQAEEAEATLARFEKLSLREFETGESIALGALVEVSINGYRDVYFFGPGSGGREIEFEDREVTIITGEAPLGRLLLGKRQGDRFEMNGRPVEVSLVL